MLSLRKNLLSRGLVHRALRPSLHVRWRTDDRRSDDIYTDPGPMMDPEEDQKRVADFWKGATFKHDEAGDLDGAAVLQSPWVMHHQPLPIRVHHGGRTKRAEMASRLYIDYECSPYWFQNLVHAIRVSSFFVILAGFYKDISEDLGLEYRFEPDEHAYERSVGIHH
eukprot:453155_1